MDSPDSGIFVPIDDEDHSSSESALPPNRKISSRITNASNTSISAILSPRRRIRDCRTDSGVQNTPVSPSNPKSLFGRSGLSVEATPEKRGMPVTGPSTPERESTPGNNLKSAENSPLPGQGRTDGSRSRWKRDFIRCKRTAEYLKTAPQDYASRNSPSKGYYVISAIDVRGGRAGHGRCRDATVVQWATIIKDAKTTDPLAPEFKGAVYEFSEDFEDNDQGLDVDSKHERSLGGIIDKTMADEKLRANNVPLSGRVEKVQRHLKIRAETRLQRKGLQSLRASSIHESPGGTPVPSVDESPERAPVPSIHESPGRTRIPSLGNPATVKDGAASRRTFLSAFSSEENANDYEFRRGEGRVQINQLHQPEIPPLDEPYRLSPTSYAYKDLNFQIFEMFTIGERIKSAKNDILALSMKGKTDQTFKILLGEELHLNIPFKDIRSLIYDGLKMQLLIQYFTPGSSSDKSLSKNPTDVLLNMQGLAQGSWAILKQCCYKIVQNREPKQRCDQATEEDFFIKKQEELMSKPKHQPQFPQTANRSAFNPKPRNNAVQKKPSTAVQATIAFQSSNNPTVSNSRESKPHQRVLDDAGLLRASTGLLSASAGLERAPKRSKESPKIMLSDEHQPEHSPKRSTESPKVLLSDEPQSEPKPKKARIGTGETTIQSSPNVKRLYYQTKSDIEICIRVVVNDQVVRLRSDEEKKRNGKRDKFDLFDGPWRILTFNSPELTYYVKHGIDDEIAPKRANYDASDWKKMLTTKVKLNFPDKSSADCWVEIGNLLLATNNTNIQGDIYPSSSTVANLQEYKALMRNPEVESREDSVNSLSVVEIKSGIKVAVVEVNGERMLQNDMFEVEKLRGKRIRLYKLNSAVVKKFKLKQDNDDSWIKRLKLHHQEITAGHLLVTEYRVHWMGWPDEDDTWSTGFGNIPQEFINDFNENSDCYRGVGIEVFVRRDDLVCAEDIARLEKRQTNDKIPTPKRRSDGTNAASTKKYVNSEAKESKFDRTKDPAEDRSGGYESEVDDETVKAIRDSMDYESQTKNLMNTQSLRDIQKKTGITDEKIVRFTENEEEEDEDEEDGEEEVEEEGEEEVEEENEEDDEDEESVSSSESMEVDVEEKGAESHEELQDVTEE